MNNEIALMDGQQYISYVEPIIEPLRSFEQLYDRMEQTKQDAQNQESSMNKTAIWVSLLTPLIFVFIYFAVNLTTFVRSSTVRQMAWIVYLGSAALFFAYMKFSNKKKSEEIQYQTSVAVENMNTQLQEIVAPIYPILLFYVPQTYQNSFALSYICSYLSNGRASNLQGAMNLYEEEMHRMRMESMQQTLVQQAKYQSALAEISAIANVSTAFSASSAASALNSY